MALLDVPRQARDRALIRVMAGCGLRVSEACNLRMEDILWTTPRPCGSSASATGNGSSR